MSTACIKQMGRRVTNEQDEFRVSKKDVSVLFNGKLRNIN